MPLIPADVHSVAFSKPPLGKWGYDEDEVDAFLDLVEAELTRLIEENDHLRDQVEQLDAQRHAASVGTGADLCPVEAPGPMMAPVPPLVSEQSSPGHDHNVHAVRVLGLAQEMAERVTGAAKAEADAMVSQAPHHFRAAARRGESQGRGHGHRGQDPGRVPAQRRPYQS